MYCFEYLRTFYSCTYIFGLFEHFFISVPAAFTCRLSSGFLARLKLDIIKFKLSFSL